MTAPQFPAAWGQPPAQPAQQYPPAAGGFPAQQPPPAQYAPPAPQQYAPPAPPQGYAPPQYGAPQGYPPAPAYDPYAQPQPYQQGPPQPPAFTPAAGTLDEYMNQKATGATYWKFKQLGEVNIGMFERDPRDSDVAQVTYKGQPVRRNDGSISQEKSLTLPVVNADGSKALIEFKSHQRTAFEEAVSAATNGASRLPKGGGMVRGTFVRTEPSRGGGSDKKIIQWEYVPPEQVQGGQAPAAAPQQAPQSPPAQDLQYATPVPAAGQYYQQPMQSPPTAPPAQPQQPAQDPAYAAWLAQQGQAPQQAAPAQQAAPPAAAYPPAQPAPVPSPNPGAGAQGAPAPQPYQPPGMDPAAAQMFQGLMGGAPPAQ